MTEDESKKRGSLTVIESSKEEKDNSQGELFQESLVREMLDVERKRIESMDKKTETARMFIEVSDASDKRQFEYQMARLKSQDDDNRRKHKLGQIVIYVGGGSLCLGLAVLMGVMFWGNPIQSALATTIFEKLFIGVGGYGVLTGLTMAVKKLINEHTNKKS